jgi:hypothetical protein
MAEHAERFAQFAARKTREATEAALPPYTTVFDSAPPDALAIGNAWSRRLFAGDFYHSVADPDHVACSLVFVQSRTGNTGARNPTALGGGETDKHLIYEGLSRVPVDAVLAGAGTVRGGQLIFSVWHPELVSLREALGLPRHPQRARSAGRLADGRRVHEPDAARDRRAAVDLGRRDGGSGRAAARLRTAARARHPPHVGGWRPEARSAADRRRPRAGRLSDHVGDRSGRAGYTALPTAASWSGRRAQAGNGTGNGRGV